MIYEMFENEPKINDLYITYSFVDCFGCGGGGWGMRVGEEGGGGGWGRR
jgi:hypothetical protein